MSMEWTPISIPFGQGTDTKADPKMLPAGKLVNLQNGVFVNKQRLTKRNGYSAFPMGIIGSTGSIVGANMIGTYGNRLLCSASGGVLYDYSETAGAWKNAGNWDSLKVDDIFISGAFPLERNANSIISGNYSVLVYDSWSIGAGIEAGNGTSTHISVLDLQTNTTIAADILVNATARYSRMFLFGDGTIGVFYFNTTTSYLSYKPITIVSGAVTLGAEVQIANGLQVYNDSSNGYSQYDWISYDLINNGNNCTLAYSVTASTELKLNTINSSGTSLATNNLVAEGNAFPISLAGSSNGNIWVYWARPSSHTASPGASTSVFYAVIDSGLVGFITGATLIGSSSAYSFVRQISAYETQLNTQAVYFSTVLFVSGVATADMVTPTLYAALNDTSGNIADPFPYKFNLDIFGKVFSYNGKNYLPCVYPSIDQFTGFLLDLSDGHAAGKFLFNTAECAYSAEVDSGDSGPAIGGYWWRYPGFLTVSSIYNNRVLFGSGKIIQSVLGTTSELKFIMGSCLVDFTFDDQDSFQALNANSIVVLNGSIPGLYDGNFVSELGFNNRPELNATIASTGGLLLAGTYQFQGVYQWSDAQGNLYQSDDSDILSVTTTGSTSKVSLVFKIPAVTQRSYSTNPIQLFVYQSVLNGSIPYQIQQVSITGSTGTVSVQAAAPVTAIQSSPIYTNGGAIVSNSAPPPSMLMWLNNNRLWMVNSEDQSIWYSKTFAQLTGISPSAFLTVAPDLRSGNIVMGDAMDEKTVLVKDSGLTYFVGDGADDSGANSSLSLPQIIPASIGGSNSKSVFIFPGGLIFRGADNRGIYLLTRGVSLDYLGDEVEEYNAQDIQSVDSVANSTQIRFLTSSGSSLVYDYYFDQWGTFTNHAGLSATNWNGAYLYVRPDGTIYQENASNFLDASSPYALSLTTAWIKAGSVQGYQRVRRALMLGNFSSGDSLYAMQISEAVDFSQTFQTPVSYTLGQSSNVVPFQYRERLPIQKGDTIQLLIEELPTGASGQYVDFSDLGLELGIKRGLNKLGASKSVG